MKIFDEKMKEIFNPDLENGKLVAESREVFHRYKVTQEEKGHYKTIREYPNGGKDVDWVVDTPEEGHWVSYDAYGNEVATDIVIPDDAPHELEIPDIEEFYRYLKLTAEELAERAEQAIQDEIAGLKTNLAETDYISAKAMDSLIGCNSISEFLTVLSTFNQEYNDVIAKRKQWREEINKLEGAENA